MQPTVTIITPTYNHEKFISQCIESVISQTFTDWEQIIIDDGSTDNTRSIISGYTDKRIKLISQDNKGINKLNETYNTALNQAKGTYIAVLEGDDYWTTNKLELQMRLFDNQFVDLVWGRVAWVDISGNHVATVPADMREFNGLNRYQYMDKLLLGNFIPAVTVLLRKERLMAIGGFQQPTKMVTVDYSTWLECIKHGEVAVIYETVGYWRRHPTQMSTARQHEILNNTMKYACDYFDSLSYDIKDRLSLNREKINFNWRKHISESCFYEGRKRLIRKQWKDARNEFINSYKYGNSVCRVKCMVGIISSLIHKDIELIVRLTGKDTIASNELAI